MPKSVLIKDENNEIKTLYPNKLTIANLCTFKDDIGYMNRKQLTELINGTPYFLTSDVFMDQQEILIQNISPVRRAINILPVKEVLTGSYLDLVLASTDIDYFTIKSNKRELNTFAFVQYITHPSLRYLKDYIEKHKDFAKYRQELEMRKEKSKFMHYIQKETKMDELFHLK